GAILLGTELLVLGQQLGRGFGRQSVPFEELSFEGIGLELAFQRHCLLPGGNLRLPQSDGGSVWTHEPRIHLPECPSVRLLLPDAHSFSLGRRASRPGRYYSGADVVDRARSTRSSSGRWKRRSRPSRCPGMSPRRTAW